ncbi:serine hydrolase [Paenibacillus sp. SCIV0701]|uniref:Serine hydrolase n=1 Tax=Paenibacillus soyae TaxID=2969249 RepID=A0A9X2SCB1_9BACL|nr:serine hydrolase [Paenibacillus soyae]MCR2806558.1 serine hydrolase [Paenibacillus soyae]
MQFGVYFVGLIVERLSGMSFTSYVEERIFRPSGMTDSGYFRLDELPERTAIGYMDKGDGWRTNHFSLPVMGGPDGGAFTTVRDMELFWKALLGNKLMTEETTALMLRPHITVNDRVRYGYGVWMTYIEGELFKYYVMGSDPGVTMVSSAYAKTYDQAHVLGNVDRGAGALASKIDEWIWKLG